MGTHSSHNVESESAGTELHLFILSHIRAITQLARIHQHAQVMHSSRCENNGLTHHVAGPISSYIYIFSYDLAGNDTVLHPFFQQHLLMNVYPMAPMPLNDHSIVPGNPVVEAA